MGQNDVSLRQVSKSNLGVVWPWPSTFDVLTSKLNHFIPFLREPLEPICRKISSFVFKWSSSHKFNIGRTNYSGWMVKLKTLSDISSLDLVVNRFFMKFFQTINIDIVNYCHTQFEFDLRSTVVEKRSKTFVVCVKMLCKFK